MRPLDHASLGRGVPWTRRSLDDAALGRRFPWTTHPLDDASLGRRVPWTKASLGHGVPDRCVVTLDRIDVFDVTSYFGLGWVAFTFLFSLRVAKTFFLLPSLFIKKTVGDIRVSVSYVTCHRLISH